VMPQKKSQKVYNKIYFKTFENVYHMFSNTCAKIKRKHSEIKIELRERERKITIEN